MTTRLFLCVALLITFGIATVDAEPQLKTASFFEPQDGHDNGLHLALGHFKDSSASLSKGAKISGKGFSVALGRTQDLDVRLHGYKDPQNQETIPNPEPATMVLLGSGLLGFAALVRKRRKASR